MTKINIVFDDMFEDADIIAIPDEIASQINAIGQEFLDWVLYANDSDYWTLINGQKCAVAETDGFIKWLNSYHCKELEKAYVLKRNTNYCSLYKTIEF